MQLLRRNKSWLLLAVSLILIYFISRLIQVGAIPIFTDEAIYMRWAQIAKNDANWRFISLTDGKQPLYIWLTMLLMRFVSDPLIAGRLVSVIAGFTTVIGLFFVGRELFKSKWVGILTSLCYVVSPFSLVYDRMALYDSTVGAFAVWGLYFTILLVRRLRLDIALLMGFITGAAVLNKSNGFFTIYLLPFAVLLLDWKKKHRWQKILRFVALSSVVVIMTYLFYSILRLSPFFYIIEQKNGLFVYPFKEWITHPFQQLYSNIELMLKWFISYMGIPYTIFIVLSFFVSKKYFREKLLLVSYFVFPFIALIIFGKQLYPRYIFFMTLSLLPLIGFSISELAQKYRNTSFKVTITVLALSYSLISSSLLLVDPIKSPIPQADKGQYIAGWPSGYGVPESIAYFKERAKDHQILIATGGSFGLMPYAYELYFNDNPNVTVKGLWPVNELIPEELVDQAKQKEVYVVFYQSCSTCYGTGLAPVAWPLQQVLQYKKIEPKTYLTVYRVLRQ